MSIFAHLTARPASFPAGSRFTIACGLFYLGAGVLMLTWPGSVQAVFRDPPYSGLEAELVRLIGLLLGIVGWLYVMGGRTGARQFVAATVPGRLIVVPLVLVPAPSSTVKSNASLTVSLPSWSYVTRPASISAWVKVSDSPSAVPERRRIPLPVTVVIV